MIRHITAISVVAALSVVAVSISFGIQASAQPLTTTVPEANTTQGLQCLLLDTGTNQTLTGRLDDPTASECSTWCCAACTACVTRGELCAQCARDCNTTAVEG